MMVPKDIMTGLDGTSRNMPSSKKFCWFALLTLGANHINNCK